MARFIRPQSFRTGGDGAMLLPGETAIYQRPFQRGWENAPNWVREAIQSGDPERIARVRAMQNPTYNALIEQNAPQEQQPTAEEALGVTLYGERRRALEQAEADRQAALADLEQQQARAEEALVEARDKGFLTEEEARQMEVEQRESYEAQFDRLARETGEAAYGLTMGARRGAAREIGVERARAVGGIPGRIGAERMARRREAYGRYGEQVAGLRERYGARRAGIRERAERPYPQIPTGFGPKAMRTAYTGQIRRTRPQSTQFGRLEYPIAGQPGRIVRPRGI